MYIKKLAICLSLAFFLSLFPLPEGYLEFVRIISLFIFGYLAFSEHQKRSESLAITFAFLSFLYQPFYHFSFNTDWWNLFYILTAIGLLVYAYKEEIFQLDSFQELPKETSEQDSLQKPMLLTRIQSGNFSLGITFWIFGLVPSLVLSLIVINFFEPLQDGYTAFSSVVSYFFGIINIGWSIFILNALIKIFRTNKDISIEENNHCRLIAILVYIVKIALDFALFPLGAIYLLLYSLGTISMSVISLLHLF